MTRISTDHRRSLKWRQTNGHRDVNSTSTSNKQQEHIGRNAKEHSTRPVIKWEYGQTLDRVRVRTEIDSSILLVYNGERTCDLKVMWYDVIGLKWSRRVDRV